MVPKALARCMYEKDHKIEIASLLHGGGHERKMRSGTLNVPGIVGLGKAAEICQRIKMEESLRLRELREQFWAGIKDIQGVKWNGDKEHSLCHVANICFDIPGGDNLIKILSKHMSVSSGSACSSATVSPSHVLKAMGLSDQQALSSIRFSLGRFTTNEEVHVVVEKLLNQIKN